MINIKRKHKNIVFNGILRKKKRKREKKSEIPKSRVKYDTRIAKLAEAITDRIIIGIK